VGFLVNLTSFSILVAISFLLIRQGLYDLEKGLWGTIFFVLLSTLFFIYLARKIFYNIFDRRDRESMIRFIHPQDNQKIRGRPDVILKTVSLLGLLTWVMIIAVIIALKETFDIPSITANVFTNPLTTRINPQWRHYTLVIALISAMVSGIGLLLKSRRNNRRNDTYPKSLVFSFLFFILLSIILI